MMIAGFPCQTFFRYRTEKRNGRRARTDNFQFDKNNACKNLKYFILENVKGLTNHDNGNSLRVILQELKRAGYTVFHQVLNSIDYGVPQMRERIYFIGIRKDLVPEDFQFYFPERQPRADVKDYLIDTKELEFDEKKVAYETFLKYLDNKYNKGQYDIKEILEQDYLVIDTRQSDLRDLSHSEVPNDSNWSAWDFICEKLESLEKLSGYKSLLLPKVFRKNWQKKSMELLKNCIY